MFRVTFVNSESGHRMEMEFNADLICTGHHPDFAGMTFHEVVRADGPYPAALGWKPSQDQSEGGDPHDVWAAYEAQIKEKLGEIQYFAQLVQVGEICL